jgi:hypothetical protein
MTLRYLSPILNIAPNVDRVDAPGQLGEKSAKIGPFFLSPSSAYIIRILKSHPPTQPAGKDDF